MLPVSCDVLDLPTCAEGIMIDNPFWIGFERSWCVPEETVSYYPPLTDDNFDLYLLDY